MKGREVADGNELPRAFDIGVRRAEHSIDPKPEATRRGRSLPRWAVAVVAILVGWTIGAVMNAGPQSPSKTARPAAADAATPTPLSPATTPPSLAQPINVPAAELLTVVMVQAPLRGVAIPADITVLDNGIATRIELDKLIAGATQGVMGQGDRRMLLVEDSIVFMALDSVMIFDPFEKTEPVEVATAIYLLPGSEPGRAWAVGSGSKSVFDIDVRRREVRAEYDLTAIGTPLASDSGGLVVAPANRRLGNFAIWSPARGVERLWTISDQTSFIGAGTNALVVHTPQGLASYNTVTGSLTQTDHQIPMAMQHRSIVSPDGAGLATAFQRSVTELPAVEVLDIQTGERIDTFDAAFAWQLQWVSDTEILFMLPGPDGVSVMLRDIQHGVSRLVTELVGPNFWVTVAS